MWRILTILVTIVLSSAMMAACAGGDSQQAEDAPDLLFSDDFSGTSAGQWLTEGDELGSTSIQDGRMLIDAGEPNAMQYATLIEPSFTDFDLALDAELVAGEREATYGVLFRLSGAQEFYRFELTGDGRYIVERHDADGSWQRLTEGWKSSSAIFAGPGSTNRLRIVAKGPAMSFSVNDELLVEVQDGRYAGGQLALDAGTYSNERSIVTFDNLQVRMP